MATLIKYDADGPKIRNPVLSDVGPVELSADPRDEIVSGETSSMFQQNDANLDAIDPAVIDHVFGIAVDGVPPEVALSFYSVDESILTVDGNGKVSRVSDGEAGVVAKMDLIGKRIDVEVSQESGASSTEFNSWIAGTTGEKLAAGVDDLIAGKTVEVNQAIWATRDHDTPEYERNPNCWAASLFSQLAAVSVWNDELQERKTVTAITPRHCVGTPHKDYLPAPGSKVRFVGSDGSIVERTVLQRIYPDGYTQPFSHPDVGVCLLDSDLPATVGFVPLVPANWNTHLVEIGYGRPPCLALNRAGDAMVKEFAAAVTDIYSLAVPSDENAQRLLFDKELGDGDSGRPIFLIRDGALNLLSLWSTKFSGPKLSSEIATINAMIASADSAEGISTGYTATEADWSADPTF